MKQILFLISAILLLTSAFWVNLGKNENGIVLFNSTKPSEKLETIKVDFIASNIKIVGVGETSHGQGSFFSAKHKLFKALVEQKGFKIFALEAGYSEALVVNKFIHGNAKQSAKEVLSFLGYGVWENEEFVALLEWMKLYNSNITNEQDKLKFVGIDCQKTHGFVSKYVELIKKYLNFDLNQNRIEELYKTGRVYDRTLAKRLRNSQQITGDKLFYWIQRDTALSSKERFVLEMELDNFQGVLEMKSSRFSDKLRAKFMAQNAVRIQKYFGSPMFISAHNGHIIKGKKDTEMGFYLEELIASSYYALGTEFMEGNITTFFMEQDNYLNKTGIVSKAKENSLPFRLSSMSEENFIFNFKDISQKLKKQLDKKWMLSDILGCYGNADCNSRYWKRNPIKSYDGILFVHRTCGSHIFWDKRPVKGYQFEYYQK